MYTIGQACELLNRGKKVKNVKWDCYYYVHNGQVYSKSGCSDNDYMSAYSVEQFFNHYNHNLYCPNEPNWVEYIEETSSTADLTSNESELYSDQDQATKPDLEVTDNKMSKVSISIQFDSVQEANTFMSKGAETGHKSKADMVRCFANHVKSMNLYNESAYKLLKISLIKLARDMFDLGLKEAKDLVEEAAAGRY